MEPARSILFIPGNRERWIESAHTHGADVVVFDLEDSVPPAETPEARALVADNIADVHDRGQRAFVRVNGHPNDLEEFTQADTEAVMCEDSTPSSSRRPADPRTSRSWTR